MITRDCTLSQKPPNFSNYARTTRIILIKKPDLLMVQPKKRAYNTSDCWTLALSPSLCVCVCVRAATRSAKPDRVNARLYQVLNSMWLKREVSRARSRIKDIILHTRGSLAVLTLRGVRARPSLLRETSAHGFSARFLGQDAPQTRDLILPTVYSHAKLLPFGNVLVGTECRCVLRNCALSSGRGM